MSYYLEDPYRYTSKCFPFIDNTKPYMREYSSNRLTEKNRRIEGEMVVMKHQYMARVSEESKSNEINLLKIRNLYNSLKDNSNEEIGRIKCEIYGARKNKENNLRRVSHDFPDFIKHRELLHSRQQLTDDPNSLV